MEKSKDENRNKAVGSIRLDTPEGEKSLLEKIKGIVKKGNDAEVRGKKDGVAVYEITKKAV